MIVDVTPHEVVAGQPMPGPAFWLKARAQSTGVVGPRDVSRVSQATLSLQLRVPRGTAQPAGTDYTLTGGALTLGTSLLDGAPYPLLAFADPPPNAPAAGVYDYELTIVDGGKALIAKRGVVVSVTQP